MNKKAQLLFWVCCISTIAAIGTHIYLTQHHYNFKFGQVANDSICNISATVNCNRTTASAYSEVMGVPVSIFGGLINFAFLCLLLAFRFPIVSRDTQEKLSGPLKIMSLGILAVSVIMAALSYAVLHTICPACTAAYVFSLIGFITTWMMLKNKPLFTTPDVKLYGALAVSISLFAFFIHHNSMRSYGGKERMEYTKLQFTEWKNYPQKNMALVSPLVMNASKSSKMKIVEFADFLCGHCASAYPIIHNFVKAHPDVEFSFQAFPLDAKCNKAIPHGEGTRCLLARLSHCAGQQDKPWKTQSWIFENQRDLLSQDNVKQKLKGKIADLELNEETLMTCLESEEAREAIRQQANLGVDVGVKGTPSLYINGKKVPAGFSIPLLEMIYREVTQ